MNNFLAVLAAVLTLAGCSTPDAAGTTSPEDAQGEWLTLPADPVQQITTNYADCLEALKVTADVVFTPEVNGSQKVGVATVDSPSGRLRWDVAISQGGNKLLTVPDADTTTILERVDC